MHYRIRANVYKLLGRGVLGSCFGVHFFVHILGGGSHVGKSSVVALVFGFGMGSCQTSVILNHCIKCGFFGLYKLQCSCEWYRALLTDFVGTLVSRISGWSGVGFRPFVVHHTSCWGGRYLTTEQFMGVTILLVLCCPI